MWSESARNYRDPATGRFMAASTRIELRNEVVARQAERIKALTEKLNAGDLTPAAYEKAMQAAIKTSQVQNYAFGRGGINAVTDDDRAAIGANIGKQFDYLAGFRKDIEGGALSAEQIAARATLYGNAGTAAFEQGKASAFGLSLPTYPGDQTCLANCRCHWNIEEADGELQATWVLEDGAAHCDDCLSNAAEYAPWKGE